MHAHITVADTLAYATFPSSDKILECFLSVSLLAYSILNEINFRKKSLLKIYHQLHISDFGLPGSKHSSLDIQFCCTTSSIIK